jgi:hypothetical protein
MMFQTGKVATVSFRQACEALLNYLHLYKGSKATNENHRKIKFLKKKQQKGRRGRPNIYIYVQAQVKLTGATRVIDFTNCECLAAKAIAIRQPMECATKWKEVNWKGQMTDFSIISK